jgi:hypothetical protein
VILAVVLVLVVAAVWAEGRRRAPSERAALAACADRAERTVTQVERRLGATVTYLGPALGSFNDELRASMRGVVSRTAGDLVGSVEEALAQCLDVGIWPFHRANADVKEAHVAWLTAERDRLRAIAEEDAAFDDGYDEVRQLGREAAATLEG